MKHLVLGSSGQIGYHLVKHLKSTGESVIEFDILRTIDEDLCIVNNELLVTKMQQCDFVHFLAFDVGGSVYMEKYQKTYDFISNNTKIMNNVFDLLKKHEKPFIFASSQMSNMLHSTYGILKAIGEEYTKSLLGIIIKFWNVYGYENDPEKTHVITDFIEMAKNKGRITMRTDGQEERQFLYGDDAAECLQILSEKYDHIDRNETLHITNFNWTKIREIGRLVSEQFGNCPVVPADKKDAVQGVKNEPDPAILKYWKPKTDLKEGIKKLIQLREKFIKE